MSLPESVQAAGLWAGVALVHVTLIALVGLLAWIAARPGGPALRGAVLLAALVGLLVVPALAVVAPVWLPLPECVCPASPVAVDATDSAVVTPQPATSDPAVFALVVREAPAPPQPDDPIRLLGETTPPKADAIVINLTGPVEESVPPPRPAEVSSPSWSPAGVLALVWLLGVLVFLGRALIRLVLLYRCAWGAHPVEAGLEEATPPVAVRESPTVISPLTLGLCWPMILLPLVWRVWSAAERTLILRHELAHIRRRDFLAGLAAELATCLCWFHPLVWWLAGRLRLEQEYAADAGATQSATDAMAYVRCLARLALEQAGERGSLAPAFWRRRPEILRRIDMLRRNPNGLAPRLGKRTAWTVAVLAALAYLAVAVVGPLQSAPDDPKPADAGTEDKAKATTDPHGDPLPAGALARLGTTRLRHGGDVTFVAFGPGGKTLITAGQDNTVRLWDLTDGKELRRFAKPAPAALKPLPKGDKPADEKAATDAIVAMMAGGGNNRGSFSVAVTPDGKTLAAAGGNIVQLWEVESGKELRRLEAPAGGLAGLLFSPDGRTVAARVADGTLVVWSAETGKEIRQIKPAPRPQENGIVLILGNDDTPPPGMAFTPDGKTLVAAATDYKKDEEIHSVKFWEIATGKETRRIAVPDNAGVASVAVTPDGKVLAYGAGNVVHLCDTDTGKELRSLKNGNALSLAFTPDSKKLAVRNRNRVRLWETESGKELYQLAGGEVRAAGGILALPGGFTGPEGRAVAISPDGKQLASAAGSSVRLWETDSGKELPLLEGHRRAPSAIRVVADGKSVVSWGPDRVIRRWDTATGKSLGGFPAPLGTNLAAFSPDGRTVALANADDSIRLYETATGKASHVLMGHKGGTAALAFAPDGKTLASRGRGDNTIRRYDLVKGNELRSITVPASNGGGGGNVIIFGGPAPAPRGTGPGLAFSPDGKLLVANGGGDGSLSNSLLLFDAATGKQLRKIESKRALASFAFSPDGRTLATEHPDRTITLWEVASGKEWGRLGKPAAEQPEGNGGGMAFRVVIDGFGGGEVSDPAGPVGLSFSPDGRALASRGADRSVRVWDVAAGKEVGRLDGHNGRVETVAFAPDGKALASGASDTTILLWDAKNPLKGLSKAETVELPAAEIDALWGALAGEDAGKAIRGVRKLAAAPGQAVPFLSQRLKPAARVDPKKIDGWIADLESEKFAVRQEAQANLLKVGEQAVPALRKVLSSSPPLETRKRVEELVERLTGGTLTVEELRLVRAVEALEQMATPEARRLLRTLAEGAPGTLPTREAQAALDRLVAPRP
jgi:WD40 repeat protein/beta-lactamase regulating signal transducer with metallopeptidase domain